ncbi:hypothetical protein N7533_009316 [Penicillium manginii]|uniref:uncharacterized protein n=1 Tax=Penicillium manginii TaxID=203109 RepID=UPI002547CE8F|nr:uncharacterized protein N7533_009316 [Penicillium manginii]KAJ5744446.1 hypothetical protein N7533_009316 [Penicillium manginii]
MRLTTTVFNALLGAYFASANEVRTHCNHKPLNTTSFNYFTDVANQTVHEIAVKFNRGVCDIGRANLMVDVSVVPNVGQTLIIPGQVCHPDWTSCIIDGPGKNDCLVGGPRLYYTVNGDTLWKIAGRLNMTLDSIQSGTQYEANETMAAGQFVKIPLCYPSACEIEPYTFSRGVYKDLADKYGSTVGQIQMLSPTYNYSSSASEGGAGPSIDIAKNCRLLSSNYTILE